MFYLGIDFGTSGARSCVIDAEGTVLAEDSRSFGVLQAHEFARTWRDALWDLIASLPPRLRAQLSAIALDGTSGTVIACDDTLKALHAPLLYDDDRARDQAAQIRTLAPAGHPAAAQTSGLAKVLWLQSTLGLAGSRVYLNQADWLAGLLTEQPGFTDYHNALKMGLDLDTLDWPDWIGPLADRRALPRPVAPGCFIAPLSRPRARYLGVDAGCEIRAGTTDSIAAFLAAGVTRSGDAVTSLGSTLVLKLLSDTRVESSEHGVYSHWFGTRWLAGGASNAGGAVLRQFFDDGELAALSAQIDPAVASGLDYLPLPRRGDRFPVNDPELAPRLGPRPADDVTFLHGLLESLARIEARGYAVLSELGASRVARVMTAGGGSHNRAWTGIRERLLGVPVAPARQTQAAYGTARLAAAGQQLFDCTPGNG